MLIWCSAFLVPIAVALLIGRRRRSGAGGGLPAGAADRRRWVRRKWDRDSSLEAVAAILLLVGIALTVAYMVLHD